VIGLHRLEGFYWVARTGGYARAARAFPYPITQPAVHQQVKKLESELGLALFERVGKEQMQLTAAGERLFRFVAPFFEGLPSVVRAVQSGDSSGTLIVHAAPMFVRHLLPRWIQRVRRSHPEGRVELLEMPHADVARLRDGSADLLVDFLPEWPDDVATQAVGTLRGFIVLPAKHPLAKRSRLSLAQLADPRTYLFPNWLPALRALHRRPNACVRPSALRFGEEPPAIDGLGHGTTSTSPTLPHVHTCPKTVSGGSCEDHDCRTCWDDTDYVNYLPHGHVVSAAERRVLLTIGATQ